MPRSMRKRPWSKWNAMAFLLPSFWHKEYWKVAMAKVSWLRMRITTLASKLLPPGWTMVASMPSIQTIGPMKNSASTTPLAIHTSIILSFWRTTNATTNVSAFLLTTIKAGQMALNELVMLQAVGTLLICNLSLKETDYRSTTRWLWTKCVAKANSLVWSRMRDKLHHRLLLRLQRKRWCPQESTLFLWNVKSSFSSPRHLVCAMTRWVVESSRCTRVSIFAQSRMTFWRRSAMVKWLRSTIMPILAVVKA